MQLHLKTSHMCGITTHHNCRQSEIPEGSRTINEGALTPVDSYEVCLISRTSFPTSL